MATASVALALIGIGAALVWAAWLAPRRGHARGRAVASPLGLAGGVVVLAGVTVAVSGLGTPQGVVGAVVAAVALVVGAGVAAVSAARAATRA